MRSERGKNRAGGGSITREKTGTLIKADGREDEQEDDFEDGEDDVGKVREDSQIARGVPSAADRSLPPVGRERPGDGGDGFRINGIAKTDGDEQDSRARTRLKGKAQEQGRPGKTWRNCQIATGMLRYCQQRLPAGREAKVSRFFFPGGGTQSWRIPLRGPRDEYLPARCLGSEDLRQCVGMGNQNALEGIARAKIGITGEGLRTSKSKTKVESKTERTAESTGRSSVCKRRGLPPVGR
ncbi:hypothetical protein L227DRAFT_658732 [Lentinus tigrinus ALCF2SS1-6]|uniref:Uncharacterized protein n=1 Tax=Lentinus tigrinus ALCF2SS1-6 TaxID=1328759 RepID=A0A5C2RQ56_9APHY|nr:hypothetical protein L227DRAFT_658732 [Lentinus tigrinus ALCF2SS1-6]